MAQRLFILFLLAALVPAAGLALIAYQQVSDTLINLNYRHLQQEARNIGMKLVQRLSWREEILQLQFATPAKNDRKKQVDLDDLLQHNKEFRSLDIVKPKSFVTLSSEQLGHLRKSKVLMQLTPNGDVVMTVAIEGSFDYLQAQLAMESLWKDENEGENYCILTQAGQPLYCSAGMPVPALEHWSDNTQSQRNSGVFAWQVNGEDHLAAFWHIPLQSSLAHDGLVVVVSDTRANVLAVLVRFRQIFPAIAILAMAMAAWFAIGQIRRQMLPLDRLEQHTKLLALGNFTSRVEVEGDDEFARLADSFNGMSDNLNHKFRLLEALGELDRAILSVTEMDSVIRLMLSHQPATVPCDYAGVLRYDSEGNILFWTIDAKQLVVESVHLSAQNRTVFPCMEGEELWLELDLTVRATQDLAFLTRQGMTRALIFPATVDKRIDSALVLAYRQTPQETKDIVQTGRSLADRLAAAAVSISWGDKLFRQGHFDALTDLPNRTLLRDRVEQALLRAERENLAVAVLIIDLDNFKDVNDYLGHAAGDALLVSCARQLTKLARQTDTVARLGGDEFILLMPDLPPAGAAAIVDRIASDLNTAIALPVDLGTRNISAPASIGIALYPENGKDIHELMKNADAAMYESKRERYGGYRFYSEQMNVEIKSHFEMIQNLRNAWDKKEFFLVYQPKIEAVTGHVIGAEALIRWASPRFGLVSPAQFIPLIEEIGLGCRLGEWVIETACAQMAAWDAQGCPPIPVSVNASPAQFRSNEIITQVRAALSRNTLAATRLELEILESTAVGDSMCINETLTELRNMEIGIALDDFGTGYSSLVYLTQLPANILKIDRGFITEMLTDQRKQAIIGQIISLANVLKFQVIAEGVEEVGQVRMLTEMGCDIFQGYFFSKPLEPEAFVRFQKETEAKLVLSPANRQA